MILTSGLNRSVSRISGCNFENYITLSSRSGECDMGLSGSDYLNFSVKSGRVFDKDNNFIDSVPSDLNLNLRYYVDGDVAKSYVNGNLRSFVSGDFSAFDYLVVNHNQSLVYNCYLSGDRPLINYSGINNFDSGVDVITGVLINETPQRRFRILSGYTANNTPAQVFLSGWETGDIVNTGALYFGSLANDISRTGEVDVFLYTNFGSASFSLNVDTNEIDQNAYQNITPNTKSDIETNSPNDYGIESYFNFGSRQLNLKLEYVSGGNSYENVTVTGLGSGYYYGNITGTGLLTGLVSGNLSGEPFLSGLLTTGYVTGHFTGTFYTIGSGYYSGMLITDVMPSGYDLTITDSGSSCFIGQSGTGLLNVSYSYISSIDYQSFSGFAQPNVYEYTGFLRHPQTGTFTEFDYSLRMTSGIPSDEYLFCDITNTSLFNSYSFEMTSGNNFSGVTGGVYVYTGRYESIPDDQISGLYNFDAYTYIYDMSGMVDFSMTFPTTTTINTDITGTGIYNRHCFSSIINESFNTGISSGFYVSTGILNMTEVWNMQTGMYYPAVYDHKNYGWFFDNLYWHSGANANLKAHYLNSPVVQINYNGFGTSGVNTVKLIATDGYLTSELLISGTGEVI